MNLLFCFVGLIFLSYFAHSVHVSPMPCNSSLLKSCPASLYYVPTTISNIQETASLFHVNDSFVTRTVDGFLITINCSCPSDANDHNFTWKMEYWVQPGDSWESILMKFGSFVVGKPKNKLIPLRMVTLDFLCGCSNSAYMVTYRIKKRDTLYAICSRFKADLNKTAWLNGLANPEVIYAGDILFIPEPDGLQNFTLFEVEGKDTEAKRASRRHILVGVISSAFIIIILLVVVLVLWKKFRDNSSQKSEAFAQRPDCLHHNLDGCPLNRKTEESTSSSFNSDKATVFPYQEILDATSNFSISLKAREGSYGLVYHGKLRGTDVAIKQMKNTKSKEFLSELNILCRVNHTNLIELIGYAAGGDSLFLVYEFAQNGALSDHLHRPTLRGHKPLPWITRVQIALDAVKGLEYIHEHTKPYYVHRDVKTSNILLDSNFRAKIADFGLVKLLEHSSHIRAAASRIVGTFGYLAPEYVRDGFVSSKSDVYSFGVVLMELLTGQPALSKDATSENDQYRERRSVVQYMLSAFNEAKDPCTQLKNCVDPNLTCYHKDSFFQMALLSKDCVDDDWNRRPDMSIIVLRLSHVLLSSKSWVELEHKKLMV